jgi:hypothetical protein
VIVLWLGGLLGSVLVIADLLGRTCGANDGRLYGRASTGRAVIDGD